MVAISTEKPVFLSALLSAVKGTIGKDTTCSDVLHDVDTISTLELCECLEALAKDSAAMERMSSLCRYREWSAFYDYIRNQCRYVANAKFRYSFDFLLLQLGKTGI